MNEVLIYPSTPLGYLVIVPSESGRINMDRIGSWASAICAVHCLLTGVALGALSIMGLGFLASTGAEIAFFATAIVVGSFAIVGGYRRHGSVVPGLIFAAGVASLLFAHLRTGSGHSAVETVFSVLGGLTLVAFHFANQRMRRKCECPDCRSGNVR